MGSRLLQLSRVRALDRALDWSDPIILARSRMLLFSASREFLPTFSRSECFAVAAKCKRQRSAFSFEDRTARERRSDCCSSSSE